MNRTEYICQLVAQLTRSEVLVDFIPASCIESAKIVEMVLKHFEIESKPLATTCSVFNPELTTWANKGGDLAKLTHEEMDAFGGWVVKIGDTGEFKEGGWDGHLATLVQGSLLLDTSIDQANRPLKNIEVSSVLYPADAEFLAGSASLLCVHKKSGCLLRYTRIDNRRFEDTPAWKTRMNEKKLIADRVIWRIERKLIRG